MRLIGLTAADSPGPKGRLVRVHTLLSAESPRSKALGCGAPVKVGPLQAKPSARRTSSSRMAWRGCDGEDRRG